jgi:protein-S-isoprenylcysteine O-methyltransferase Ste14
MHHRQAPHRLTRAVTLLGGALFVVALGAGAWFYAVRLAPTPDRPSLDARIAARNTALFLLFALHHSVMARSGAKRWLARHAPPPLERSLYVWGAGVLFLLVCVGWIPTSDVAWRLDGAAAWAGSSLQALGLLVTVLGARVIDPLDLAGISQAPSVPVGGEDPRAAAPAPTDPARPALSEPLDRISTRGPYGFVRHPIYLGWLLLVWAVPVMSSGRLLFAALGTLYLVVAIPLEERSLAELHPSEYLRYRERVRWRVVPGLW